MIIYSVTRWMPLISLRQQGGLIYLKRTDKAPEFLLTHAGLFSDRLIACFLPTFVCLYCTERKCREPPLSLSPDSLIDSSRDCLLSPNPHTGKSKPACATLGKTGNPHQQRSRAQAARAAFEPPMTCDRCHSYGSLEELRSEISHNIAQKYRSGGDQNASAIPFKQGVLTVNDLQLFFIACIISWPTERRFMAG